MIITKEKSTVSKNKMEISEMFTTLFSGVLLPSYDVYSDMTLSFVLINSGIPRGILFGWIMQIPVILSTIFQIPHWWEIEANMKKRCYTLPLLILQFWPQSCMLRTLYAGWKNDMNWTCQKSTLQNNVITIGKLNSS